MGQSTCFVILFQTESINCQNDHEYFPNLPNLHGLSFPFSQAWCLLSYQQGVLHPLPLSDPEATGVVDVHLYGNVAGPLGSLLGEGSCCELERQ